MTNETNFLKRYSKAQWSFFWAGITFGIAQIVYMVGLWIQKIEAGKTATMKPITVTTDLGKMFRGLKLLFIEYLTYLILNFMETQWMVLHQQVVLLSPVLVGPL